MLCFLTMETSVFKSHFSLLWYDFTEFIVDVLSWYCHENLINTYDLSYSHDFVGKHIEPSWLFPVYNSNINLKIAIGLY